MKKYFKRVWDILKGYRGAYIFYFFLQFCSVFIMILSTYTAKILSDTITKDILNSDRLGVVGGWVVALYGGAEFLINNLWIFAIIYIAIAILGAGFSIWRIVLRGKMTTAISKKIMMNLFYHIERLPYPYLKKCKSGDIIQTCTRDEAVLRRFVIFQTSQVVWTFYIVILAGLILFSIDWKLALVSMALMPVLFIYAFFLSKKVRKAYRATDDSEGLVTAKIEENLNSVRVVKAYNNEKYEINAFDHYLNDFKAKFISWKKISSFFSSSSDILVFGQMLLTMLYGGYLTAIGEISVGTFILANSFSTMIVWPLRDCARILSDAARAVVALDRMDLILKEPIEDINSGTKPPIHGDIVFDRTSFIYDDGDEAVLNDISLHIKPGETIAIMGKTGSGKSTLSHLLTRLYDYTGGSIKLDGVELNTISKEWLRKNISCVLQEPFLFSKTIINNIKIAYKNVSDEEVYKAAKIAAIDESIREFKDGYDTPVGENGITLSGGQKQRVAIARSLINNAPILIFDDSLSAVDTETDIKIRKALAKRSKQSTTIIITHRVATAIDADKIVVLENGKISQLGKHQDLIKQEGLYKNLFDIQTRMV